MKKSQKYQLTQTFYFDTFGQMIIFLRGKNGYTQGDLAKRMKTKQSAIAKWEKDIKPPSLTSMQRISEAFGLGIKAPYFACKKCDKNITDCKCKNS